MGVPPHSIPILTEEETCLRIFLVFFSFFFFFCRAACGILVPRPGIEPTPPAMGARSLNTGPPGKSLFFSF